MRITNGMMADQFLSNANSSLNRLSKAYAQTISGKRITSISDDPLSTISTLKARTRKSTLEMYESNITAATANLKEMDSDAYSLNKAVQSAYESMVSANSGTKTQDELDAIAETVENLRDEVMSIGNTSIGGAYIFGGYSTSDAPFSKTADGDLLYNGINLTDLGAYQDYSENMTKMSDLAGKISDLYTSLQSSDSSDYYAQNTICAELYSSLKEFSNCGETALSAAGKFINEGTTSQSYKDLSKLVDSASSVMAELYSEMNQELQPDKCCVISSDSCKMKDDGAGNQVIDTQYYTDNGVTLIDSADAESYEAQGYTVVASDAYENYFHKSSANGILGSAFGYETDSSGATINNSNFLITVVPADPANLDEGVFALTDASGNPVTDAGGNQIYARNASFGSDLGEVLSNSKKAFESSTENKDSFTKITDAQTALKQEEKNQVMLQVGNTQTVAITYPGTDLLGSGNENIYYVLDQCAEALRAGDTDKFTDLIGNLQDRQSDILTFETKIGASINRLDSLTDRYDTSILNYEEQRSDAEDIDEAAAITAWKTAQTVYDAALAAGSSMIQTSLIDFLT